MADESPEEREEVLNELRQHVGHSLAIVRVRQTQKVLMVCRTCGRDPGPAAPLITGKIVAELDTEGIARIEQHGEIQEVDQISVN